MILDGLHLELRFLGLRTVPSDGYGRPIGRSCDGNGTPVYRPSSERLKLSTATDGCKDGRQTVDGAGQTLKYFKPLYICIYIYLLYTLTMLIVMSGTGVILESVEVSGTLSAMSYIMAWTSVVGASW